MLCLPAAKAQEASDVGDVVNLNVVALDNKGQPVPGLTEQDFTVTDSGKTRSLAYLRHIDRRLQPRPAPGPNEFSNRQGESIPHATVILLDLMNMRFNTRSLAANQIVKSLGKVDSAEFLYLYFLTIEGRIYPVRGIPGPEAPPENAGSAWTKNIKQTMVTAMQKVLRMRPIDEDVALRTAATYDALEALAGQLSTVPGRKNIVWVTDGVPITLGPIRSDTMDAEDFTPRLKRLSAALDRAHISIYPSRQIMIGSQDAPEDAPGVPHDGSANGTLSDETLNQFAGMTGGRPNGGRDVGAAITQAMIDARTSYQLGYYVPPGDWDGKFHKIRVVCSRPGIRIQTKKGYYAWPQSGSDTTRQAMQTALSQRFDSAEIGLRASIKDSHLNVVIDTNDLAFIHANGKYRAQLSLALMPLGPAAEAKTVIQPLDIQLTPEQASQAKSEGLSYLLDLPSGKNINSWRLLVWDEIGENIGSLSVNR